MRLGVGAESGGPDADSKAPAPTAAVMAWAGLRTVLARDVPDDARYLVPYDVDYIEPAPQTVRFKIWH